MSYFEDFEEYRIGSLENDIMYCKLQVIKEFLEEELEKNKTITVESNNYNLGIKDELEYITSKINKIIGE